MQEEKTETGILADEAAVPEVSEEPEVPAAVEEPGDPAERLERLEREKADLMAELASERKKADLLLREAAVRRVFEENGIRGGFAEIALRGMKDEIAGIPLDGEGKITGEGKKILDGLLNGIYAPLKTAGQVPADSENPAAGVPVPHPPLGRGSGFGERTREEILAIRDGAERRRAILAAGEMFGI